jgi:IS5 family transposase
MRLSTGTIVDATIINAPSSTKNKDKQRDPEMHQTKKGNLCVANCQLGGSGKLI